MILEGYWGQKMKNRIFRVFMSYIGSIYLVVVIQMIFVNVIMINPAFVAMVLIVVLSVPIIIYGCLMEFFVNPKVANSYLAIFISMVLWAIAGGVFASYVLMSIKGFDLKVLLRFGVVGLLSGMWVRFIYVRETKGQQLPSWYRPVLVWFYNVVVTLFWIGGIIFVVLLAQSFKMIVAR